MKYVLHFYASCKSMKDVKTSIIAKIHNDELTYGVSGASKSDQIRELRRDYRAYELTGDVTAFIAQLNEKLGSASVAASEAES